MQNVIVLNADYSFLSTVSWQNAICLLLEEKAEAVELTDNIVKNISRTVEMVVPSVIRLLKYVGQIFKMTVPFSKRNVFNRDRNTCGYCNTHIEDIRECTIDHIVPRAQGGKTTWMNCITSCKKCNYHKADRTPEQAKMKLVNKPYVPSMSQHIKHFTKSYNIDKIVANL